MDEIEQINDEEQVPITNELEAKIAEIFLVFDKTNKQCVDLEYLPTIIHALGCVLTQEEMKELVKSVENKESRGKVLLATFMPTMTNIFTTHKFKPLDADSLMNALRKFDPEGHGYIKKDLFATMLTEYGEPFEDEELEEIMALAVDPQTQTVTYEYYMNQLLYEPAEENDLYIIADKIEEAKPKIVKKTMSQMMRDLENA